MSTTAARKKKSVAKSKRSTKNVEVDKTTSDSMVIPSLFREYDQIVLNETRGISDCCGELKKAAAKLCQPIEGQGVGQMIGSISNLDDWTKKMRGQRADMLRLRLDLQKQVQRQAAKLQNAFKLVKEGLAVTDNGIGTTGTKSRGGQQQNKPDVPILEAHISDFNGPKGRMWLQNNSKELTVYFTVTPLAGCVVSKEENGPIVNQLMSIPPGGKMKLHVSHENDPRGVGPDEGSPMKEYTMEVAHTTAEPDADTVWKFVWVPYSIFWNMAPMPDFHDF